MVTITPGSLFAFLIVSVGGYFLGRLFWGISKALARPLAIIASVLLGLVAFVLINMRPGSTESEIKFAVFLAIIAGLLIQQLLLVASIATLESEVSTLKHQVRAMPLDKDLVA